MSTNTTPAAAKFAFSRTSVAAIAGSAASPNLPFGDWTFVATPDGKEPLLKEAASRAKNTDGTVRMVKFYVVKPTGNPAGVERRVYPGALASDSANGIIFQGEEMVKSAVFGIYQTKLGSVVSGDASAVSAGISQAQQDYSDKRAADELAKKATTAPASAIASIG